MEPRPDGQAGRGVSQQLNQNQQRPAPLSPRYPINETGRLSGQPPPNLHRLDSRTSLSPSGSPQFPPPRPQFPQRLQSPGTPPGHFPRPPQGLQSPGRFPHPGSPGIRPPFPNQRLPFNPQNQIRTRPPLEATNSQLRFPPRIVTNNEGLRTPRDLRLDKMEDDKNKRPVSRDGYEEDDDDDVVMDEKEAISSTKDNEPEQIQMSSKAESLSPSPKPMTPVPTPSPKAATPSPIPSPKVATPVPSPSPKAATPEPSFSPKAETPVAIPSPKVATPVPIPSPKAATPEPSFSPKAETPVAIPSPKVATPVPSPSPKVATPMQSPSPKVPTPIPSPSPKAVTPEPVLSSKAATPIPSPSPKAATPVPSPSPKAAASIEDLKNDQEDQSRSSSSRSVKSPTKSLNLLEPGSRSITPSPDIKGFDNGKPRSLTPKSPSPKSPSPTPAPESPSPKAISPLPKTSPLPSPTLAPPSKSGSPVSATPVPSSPAATPSIPVTPVTASSKPPISPKTPGTPKEDKKKTTFADDTIQESASDQVKFTRIGTPAVIDKPEPPQFPLDTPKSMKRSTSGRSIKSEATENGTSQATGNEQPTTNGVAVSPTKKPSKPKTVGSPIKSPSKSIKSLPRTPEAGPPSTDKKKLPMNKVQVGAAPSPNLKTVRSKIGSLENASYKPGGGKIKIENRKLDFSNAQPKIAAKNDKYTPSGGDKKITQVKLQWNAKPKVGSLDNATYKPGGGDKKIETIKLDFKDKAKPKVGSKDNAKHTPGGGTVKSGATTPKTPQEMSDNIETQKIDIKAESKVGSKDNLKHKPGGGDKKIFDDKDYLRQMGGSSNAQSVNGSGTQEKDPNPPPSTPTRLRPSISPVTPQALRTSLIAKSPETPKTQPSTPTEASNPSIRALTATLSKPTSQNTPSPRKATKSPKPRPPSLQLSTESHTSRKSSPTFHLPSLAHTLPDVLPGHRESIKLPRLEPQTLSNRPQLT